MTQTIEDLKQELKDLRDRYLADPSGVDILHEFLAMERGV